MRRQYYQRKSSLAVISRWLSVYCFALLVFVVILHRFLDLPSDATINLLALAFLGGGIGFILAVFSLVRIWNNGDAGAGQAAIGAVVGALMFAIPAWYLPSLVTLPQINDVTTDTRNPPDFTKARILRPVAANPATYPRTRFARLQREAYPDIGPLIIERSSGKTYQIVTEAVNKLGWKIVRSRPPQGRSRVGIIEAVDRTLLLGFKDDIVIRISGDDEGARIDVRSASRYGSHDLGRNAKRIRRLFNEVRTNLDQFERAFTDRITAAQEARKKAKAEAEKRRLQKLRAYRKKRHRVRSKTRRGRKRRKRRRKKPQWNPF